MRPAPLLSAPLLQNFHRPFYSRLLTRRLFSIITKTSPIAIRDVPATHLGHIRILSLNNRKSRNAISRELLFELSRAIGDIKTQVNEEAERGEVIGAGTRAVVLASAVDEAFCAGADLKERKEMSQDETRDFLTFLRSTLDSLEALPVPTITAVSSLALGGGLELALATDIRVFASTAQVGLPETRLGIIPGAGGTWRLQKLIGKSAALEMILTGRRLNGIQARKLALSQICVSDDRLTEGEKNGENARKVVLKVAVGVAKEMCKGAPGAVQAALRAVREGSREAEKREYEAVVGMEDRNEALRAFAEKRQASFRGR